LTSCWFSAFTSSSVSVPDGLAQLELAQQHVVACHGQVALGLEQLALGVEHVDVDAHAHLVAQLVGVQRALAGLLGGLQGLDLAHARLHAKEGAARGLGHVAAGGFQVGLGLLFQRQGFLHAVLHGKAGKQRQVQRHAHGGVVGARVDVGRVWSPCRWGCA
jgi:hypothetical protein